MKPLQKSFGLQSIHLFSRKLALLSIEADASTMDEIVRSEKVRQYIQSSSQFGKFTSIRKQ